MRTLRLLHVVESLGGGVTSVLRDHIRLTPEHEHHLLVRERAQAGTGETLSPYVASTTTLPASPAAAVRAVARAAARLRPDIVHAHSSLAGLYVRTAPRSPGAALVYTPHCYAFERRDVSRAVRAAFLTAEKALARRTDAVLAVSPREAALARRLAPARAVHLVVNGVEVMADQTRGAGGGSGVVTAGRVVAQKDPGFFAAAACASAREHPGTPWTWLGGGDPTLCQELTAAGVEVSGWLPRHEVLRRMASASVYVHTAGWEGCPVTLLEAAALGLPVVARDIPALADLGLPALAADPEGLAGAVARLQDSAAHAVAVAASDRLAARHHPTVQARQLRAAYDAVTGAAATGEGRR